jgi:hypothetical protein
MERMGHYIIMYRRLVKCHEKNGQSRSSSFVNIAFAANVCSYTKVRAVSKWSWFTMGEQVSLV